MEQDTFLRLAKHRAELCLTLTMPTVVAGRETRQNPIRFKNLLSAARDKLAESGLSEEAAEKFLADVAPLENDPPFWRHQEHGLAIFLGGGEHHQVKTPFTLEETAVVADTFHVMPLLPMVTENRDFYVLALNRNDVRLFEANRFREKQVEVPNLPTTMDEALRLDDPHRTLQHHSAASGDNQGIHHGQGGGRDNEPNLLNHFADILDAHLTPFLNQRQLPLVVAAHGELLAHFMDNCSYAHKQAGLDLAPEASSPAELREKAWQAIDGELARRRSAAIEDALRKISHNQATVDKEEALVAAKEGRAEAALVAGDRHVWTGQMLNGVNGDPHVQRVDLLNEIARHTLIHGGQVYVVPGERLPQNEPLVVTLRY